MAKDSGAADTAKVEKAIKAATKGLTQMQADLTKAVIMVKQDKFTEKRAKAIAAKAMTIMSKHKGVLKLQSEKGFEEFPEDLQKQVQWLDGLMNDLLDRTQELPKTTKLMKKSPEKDIKLLAKRAKVLALEVSQAPKHVSVLAKEVKKGLDAGGPNGERAALMPMILLMYLISDTVAKGLREKP